MGNEENEVGEHTWYDTGVGIVSNHKSPIHNTKRLYAVSRPVHWLAEHGHGRRERAVVLPARRFRAVGRPPLEKIKVITRAPAL